MAQVTPEQVRAKVEEIKEVAHDPEWAHGLEDKLCEWVIRAIATGNCTDPRACAVEAIKSREIQFPRWAG